MHERSALGAADVTDEVLAAMVARLLGEDDVELVDSRAQTAAYDLQALTTAGRYRVTGRARTRAGLQPFALFVKVVQSFARSPLFAVVPPEQREQALRLVPWRVEPWVYRSDLAARLPEGLSMPRALAVLDLGPDSAAIWLEHVDVVGDLWDVPRYERAAYLLGRLAASPRVRPLATADPVLGPSRIRGYAGTRVRHGVVPALRSDDLWRHPLVAQAFDDRLRDDLRAAADDLDALVDELETLPLGALHGDACTRNLLVRRGSPDLVLIDFGFWGGGPLGFDLGQLLLGEVQLGERPASWLPALEVVCLPAYVDGLHDEGREVGLDEVARAHALLMLLFSGLSAVPVEHLQSPPSPALQELARQRAESARFVLDLVRATA